MIRVWKSLSMYWENYGSPVLIRLMTSGIFYLAIKAAVSCFTQQPVQLGWRETLLMMLAIVALMTFAEWQEKRRDEA